MLSIHQRSFGPADRSQAGQGEGDLIVCKNQGSVIGTLVERQNRLIRLLSLPICGACSLRPPITASVADHRPSWFGRSSGTRASRCHCTSRSPPTSGHRSASPTRTHRGGAQATRAATDCWASTFLREPTSITTRLNTCAPSRTSSTTVPAASSQTAVPPSPLALC
jgi:hypothetical protein